MFDDITMDKELTAAQAAQKFKLITMLFSILLTAAQAAQKNQTITVEYKGMLTAAQAAQKLNPR